MVFENRRIPYERTYIRNETEVDSPEDAEEARWIMWYLILMLCWIIPMFVLEIMGVL